MIRGTTAQFKFHMPKSFDDICIVEVIFGQKGNEGTLEAPLPIKKFYNRGYVKVKTWHPANKKTTNIYFDGQKYYKYENDMWVAYDHVDIYPLNFGIQIDENDPRLLLVTLDPFETMRFSDKRKGYIQILTYCDTDNIIIGSYDSTFNIYPVRTNDIKEVLPFSDFVYILDAGEI